MVCEFCFYCLLDELNTIPGKSVVDLWICVDCYCLYFERRMARTFVTQAADPFYATLLFLPHFDDMCPLTKQMHGNLEYVTFDSFPVSLPHSSLYDPFKLTMDVYFCTKKIILSQLKMIIMIILW